MGVMHTRRQSYMEWPCWKMAGRHNARGECWCTRAGCGGCYGGYGCGYGGDDGCASPPQLLEVVVW